MTLSVLDDICCLHVLWLGCHTDGVRAMLTDANLTRAILTNAKGIN